MDLKKMSKFNERMGVKVFRGGGHVGSLRYFEKRKNFASGGATNPATGAPIQTSTPAAPSNQLSGPTTQGGGANTNVGNGIIGAINQSLGTANNFQASGAPIQAGTNVGQLNQGYNAAQNALGQQNNLVAQTAPGVGQGVGSQGALTQMYFNQANGIGPNPAQSMLNQNTGENIAQTAALLAGQRGAAANPGLAGINAANAGANIQQQAVGQAATTEAQQQLAAEQNLQNLAATQIGQGQSTVQGANNAAQNEQNILQGANTSFNNAAVGQQSNLNNVNSQVASENAKGNGNILSGVGNLLSNIPVVGSLFQYNGGEIRPGYAMGGITGEATSPNSGGYVANWLNSASNSSGGPNIQGTPAFGGQGPNPLGSISSGSGSGGITDEELDQSFNEAPGLSSTGEGLMAGGAGDAGGGLAADAMLAYDGGKVPAMVSPGERYLSPDEVRKVVEEGANPQKLGKKFLGKPKVRGNSIKNDEIPTTLEEGGVVIDRETMAKKSPEAEELFVRRAVHMKNPKKKGA